MYFVNNINIIGPLVINIERKLEFVSLSYFGIFSSMPKTKLSHFTVLCVLKYLNRTLFLQGRIIHVLTLNMILL